jgi:hypothetical protein
MARVQSIFGDIGELVRMAEARGITITERDWTGLRKIKIAAQAAVAKHGRGAEAYSELMEDLRAEPELSDLFVRLMVYQLLRDVEEESERGKPDATPGA